MGRKMGALVACLFGYLVVKREIMEGENKWMCMNNCFFIYLFMFIVNDAVHEFNLCKLDT
jgi:hypothetical protein